MENKRKSVDLVDRRKSLDERRRSVDVVDYAKIVENEQELKTERFYYTIVAPKSFRANTIFTANVTIHDAKCEFDEPVVVRVSVEDEENDGENTFNAFRDVVMKTNVTETISIPIGDVSFERNYKFVVKGISGITIEQEACIDLQTQHHSILIQTDKAIYKANDCIKFRVFVLDSELRAANINDGDLNIRFTVSEFIFNNNLY